MLNAGPRVHEPRTEMDSIFSNSVQEIREVARYRLCKRGRAGRAMQLLGGVDQG